MFNRSSIGKRYAFEAEFLWQYLYIVITIDLACGILLFILGSSFSTDSYTQSDLMHYR